MNYQIAIPSYNRPEKICTHSLDLLVRHNICFDNLTIFLHTDEQKILYQESFNKYYPNVEFNIHITNQEGIGKTRTYIRRYYDDDSKVFFLDDDMKDVLEKGKDRCEDLHKMICDGFNECEKANATLWGITYYDNQFYMKDTITTTLKQIAGGICGAILTKEVKEFDVEIDQWEDYLFTIKHFTLNGKVVRMNKYGILHKAYDPDGGICSAMGGRDNRIKMLEQSAKELCKQYPEACKFCNKGKMPSIRLNWRYKVNLYKIAIPSYNRASKLCQNTLKLLQREHIDFDIVTIFVNDSEQKDLYKKTINDFYGKTNINIEISNEKGIGRNRTFMRRFYNDNEKVVFLDDDIEEILEKDKKRCENFNALFLKGFDICRKENATLWGIPLVDNHFYMKDNVSTNLKYIGAVYGVILTQEVKKIDVNIDQWEDYLISVEHFNIDKKVIRLNKYGIKSKWYNADGGICSAMGGKENRINMLDESAKQLCSKYPDAMKVYYKKDNLPNIRLNWRYKVK